MHVVEAKALHELGVEVDLTAGHRRLPRNTGRACMLRIWLARRAVRALIWRMKAKVALLDIGELPMDVRLCWSPADV